MPFSGFDDWDDCIQTMTEEEGHDQQSAENICGALQAESKSDHGNVDELMSALEQGSGLIADVGVDLVSGVDVPAVDSKWTMLKSDDDGHDYRVNTPILLSKQDDDDEDDEERRISYAAAMIPREPDKEGDVVATPTVERAAHDFLAQDGGVDTDHSLIDGDGEVVESWVLKEDRTFTLPDGSTETYGAGTWMVGIKWAAEPWQRIKSGELTGLSIYGMAEHVPLERAAKCGCGPSAKQLDIPLANESIVHLVYESRTAAEKASEEIGLEGEVHEHEFDGMTVFMPGETHEEFVDRYTELSEENSEELEASLSVAKAESGDTPKGEASESGGMGDATDKTDDGSADAGDGDAGTDDGPTIGEVAASLDDLAETVSEMKDAVTTEKQDERELAADLGDMYDVAPGDVLDVMSAVAQHDMAEVMNALDSLSSQEPVENADDMDEDDEDEEEKAAETETAEKRAEDAYLGKGSDSRQTAAKGIDTDDQTSQGIPSYRAAAEEQEDA